jgi:predicted permease
MNRLFQDVRYAVRQLRREPVFTVIALTTLALGIGANTGIFSLVNAVLFKSLPVPHPEQLYLVKRSDQLAENQRFSYPMFREMKAAIPPSASVAAMTWPTDFYVSMSGSRPEMATGQLVSGNYFETLETYPAIGRLLNSEDDRVVSGSPVAVLSFNCWQQRFGGSASVLGQKIRVNGMPFVVVGVAAPRFFGARAGAAPDFWLPTAMQSDVRYAAHYSQSEGAEFDRPWVPQRDIRWLQFVVRLRDRSAFAQTASAIGQVYRQELQRAAVGIQDLQERAAFLQAHLELEPGSRGVSSVRRNFSQPLLVLMGMVGLVLLIACANLANLLLARATAREKEIAVRLSLGAKRSRLFRQLLSECLLLSLCGGLIGVGVSYWCCSVLPRWASTGTNAIPLNLSPDMLVLGFSMAITVLTAILFGLAPALQASQVEPVQALKTSGRGPSGNTGLGRAWSFKHTLVSAQVALSLVLLVGAGLFLRTLENLVALDPGFDREHMLSVWVDTHMGGYSVAQLPVLYRRLIERVEALPGVRSAALATCGLATGCADASDIYLPGIPHTDGETDSQERRVSQHYLSTTGIPLLAGRDFADTDTEKSPPVAIVNQTFVHQFLHDRDAVGQYFGYDAVNDHRFQIIGVMKDARLNEINDSVPPMIYHSITQDVVDAESLDVRTDGDPALLLQPVREAVRSVDPNLPIGGVTTLSDQIGSDLAQQKMIARVTTIFGMLAMALACLGLYGVMSYVVSRRTGELGVRLALGASRGALLWLVLRQSLIMACAGLGAGLVLSLLAGRFVRSLLFGLSPYDPGTMIVAACTLLALSILSGLVPARRAARVDPIIALRYE